MLLLSQTARVSCPEVWSATAISIDPCTATARCCCGPQLLRSGPRFCLCCSLLHAYTTFAVVLRPLLTRCVQLVAAAPGLPRTGRLYPCGACPTAGATPEHRNHYYTHHPRRRARLASPQPPRRGEQGLHPHRGVRPSRRAHSVPWRDLQRSCCNDRCAPRSHWCRPDKASCEPGAPGGGSSEAEVLDDGAREDLPQRTERHH